MSGKKALVTVGTTKFEELIEAASTFEVLNALNSLGFTFIQYQVGLGKYSKKIDHDIKLNYQMFFEDFNAEIKKYDLIISHAGAGTCLEVLGNNKHLIMVVNDTLMDNHQLELAEQLSKLRYAWYCRPKTLQETILQMQDDLNLKPYPKPDKNLFSNYLDKAMGFCRL